MKTCKKHSPRIEWKTIVTDDMLENKPLLEKNSYHHTERSKELLLNCLLFSVR